MLCTKCGNKTMRTTEARDYSLTPFIGVNVNAKRLPIEVCSTCGAEQIDGKVLEMATMALTMAILDDEKYQMNGDEARFLRKQMGLTQEELAAKIGANKVTVSDWERGAEGIGHRYDYMLRGLMMVFLHEHSYDIRLRVLRGARTEPKLGHEPLILPDFLMEKTNETMRHKCN